MAGASGGAGAVGAVHVGDGAPRAGEHLAGDSIARAEAAVARLDSGVTKITRELIDAQTMLIRGYLAIRDHGQGGEPLLSEWARELAEYLEARGLVPS